MPKLIDGMTQEEIGSEQKYLIKKDISDILDNFNFWFSENGNEVSYRINVNDMILIAQILIAEGYGEVTDKERLEFLEARINALLRKIEQEHHWAHKQNDYEAADAFSKIYGRLKETIEQAFGGEAEKRR